MVEFFDGIYEVFSGFGANDELPSVAFGGVFVEGGNGGGNREGGDFFEGSSGGPNFFDGGLFGFHGDFEFGDKFIGWETGFGAFFEEVGGKIFVVFGGGVGDDGVVGLESLDENFGVFEVATADAADDLGEELVNAFFGGEIWEV